MSFIVFQCVQKTFKSFESYSTHRHGQDYLLKFEWRMCNKFDLSEFEGGWLFVPNKLVYFRNC